MARALTSGELTFLRTPGQHSKLYLAIHTPAVVFQARVNQTFDTDESVAEITYDGGVGTYTNILPGMTMYVGSQAGGYDLGMVRIRKAATSTVIYIGEDSEIIWDDDLYLTVVNEFGLWQKHLHVVDNVPYMDYDITYVDQHQKPAPVPVLGSDFVLWKTDDNPQPGLVFSATDSWIISGAITAYQWSAPGCSFIIFDNTHTCYIFYNAPGVYRVSCTLTTNQSVQFTAYRNVFVYSAASPPVSDFRLDNCAGDYQSGGWSFRVTMYDQASFSTVRDRAKVLLFAEDWYGDEQVSIGPQSGRENIICAGWIDGESIEWNPIYGTVAFDVKGASHWLNKELSFPVGIEDKQPDISYAWTNIDDLTIDKALWHLLHWRSTATSVMDCTLTGDTRQSRALSTQMGTLWQQLTAFSDETILAWPACDRYGRLYIQINSQLIPITDRASIPVVQALSKNDWRDRITIERRPSETIGLMMMAGVSYLDGVAAAICVQSPGSVPGHYGALERRDHLQLESVEQALELCGLYHGWKNNQYPSVGIPMASNYRAVDIAPHQYMTMYIGSTDTPRGIVWAGVRVIPRRVSFRYDAKTGVLLTDLDIEAETDQSNAIETNCKDQPRPRPRKQPPTPPEWPIIPPYIPLLTGSSFNGTSQDLSMSSNPSYPVYAGPFSADYSALTGTTTQTIMPSDGTQLIGSEYIFEMMRKGSTLNRRSIASPGSSTNINLGYSSAPGCLAVLDSDTFFVMRNRGGYMDVAHGSFSGSTVTALFSLDSQFFTNIYEQMVLVVIGENVYIVCAALESNDWLQMKFYVYDVTNSALSSMTTSALNPAYYTYYIDPELTSVPAIVGTKVAFAFTHGILDQQSGEPDRYSTICIIDVLSKSLREQQIPCRSPSVAGIPAYLYNMVPCAINNSAWLVGMNIGGSAGINTLSLIRVSMGGGTLITHTNSTNTIKMLSSSSKAYKLDVNTNLVTDLVSGMGVVSLGYLTPASNYSFAERMGPAYPQVMPCVDLDNRIWVLDNYGVLHGYSISGESVITVTTTIPAPTIGNQRTYLLPGPYNIVAVVDAPTSPGAKASYLVT